MYALSFTEKMKCNRKRHNCISIEFHISYFIFTTNSSILGRENGCSILLKLEVVRG